MGKDSCNFCEKKIHPRSMQRHIQTVHTIKLDDENFIRVLSKKKDITCKLCHITYSKPYNLKNHIKNKHEGYNSDFPNRLVFGKNVFVVSEEEKIMPNYEWL